MSAAIYTNCISRQEKVGLSGCGPMIPGEVMLTAQSHPFSLHQAMKPGEHRIIVIPNDPESRFWKRMDQHVDLRRKCRDGVIPVLCNRRMGEPASIYHGHYPDLFAREILSLFANPRRRREHRAAHFTANSWRFDHPAAKCLELRNTVDALVDPTAPRAD